MLDELAPETPHFDGNLFETREVGNEHAYFFLPERRNRLDRLGRLENDALGATTLLRRRGNVRRCLERRGGRDGAVTLTGVDLLLIRRVRNTGSCCRWSDGLVVPLN